MRTATTQTNHIENGSLLRQKKNLTDNKSGQVELKGFSSTGLFLSQNGRCQADRTMVT